MGAWYKLLALTSVTALGQIALVWSLTPTSLEGTWGEEVMWRVMSAIDTTFELDADAWADGTGVDSWTGGLPVPRFTIRRPALLIRAYEGFSFETLIGLKVSICILDG